jgi:hypothetical protein
MINFFFIGLQKQIIPITFQNQKGKYFSFLVLQTWVSYEARLAKAARMGLSRFGGRID